MSAEIPGTEIPVTLKDAVKKVGKKVSVIETPNTEEPGKIKLARTKKAAPSEEVIPKEKAAKKPKKEKPVTETVIEEPQPLAVEKNIIEAAKLSKKIATKKVTNVQASRSIKLTFQLRFHTKFGQTLYLTGNHELFGNNDREKAVPLEYHNHELWAVTLTLDNAEKITEPIVYNYLLKDANGAVVEDWGTDKTFVPANITVNAVTFVDSWNNAGYYENAFYTEPFKNVLLKTNYTDINAVLPAQTTHIFKVKAPLLTKGQALCITGNTGALNYWQMNEPVLLSKEPGDIYYQIKLDLTNAEFPVVYKYGVYDVAQNRLLHYEGGNDRLLFDMPEENKLTVVNDGFAVLQNNSWKGAGVAIPVFSLRTEKSFGVGEFSDLNFLVDWSKKVGLKLVQLLPVNDTTATHGWEDCYPYAAISAFALHPLYINVGEVAGEENKSIIAAFEEERKQLNSLSEVDYENVMKVKSSILKQLYNKQGKTIFKSEGFQQFFTQNKHWLVPYAAFCFLRDEYSTPDYTKWPQQNTYSAAEIDALTAPKSKSYDAVAINYFIQYHLHRQLNAATEYAHKNGVIVKGDIAIGVLRSGADTWQQPELFNLNAQAGAPPDDFGVKGQNWQFPTYNWQRMQQDGFAWWKNRFAQMSYYFDAFRIDHILGFFRIWSIPMHAIEGVMGYFVPAIPVHVNEFEEKGIPFDFNRYTKPFITEDVLWEMFGDDKEYIKSHFLTNHDDGTYSLKPEFDTQRKIADYFASQEQSHFNHKMRIDLFDLVSNVLLFEADGSDGNEFHFRFAVDTTASFKKLDTNVQESLKDLYINYFFRRQDDFWKKEALQKLPALKKVTNMLICGEDLGLVPGCVPDIMQQLGLLSLEVQRMPKQLNAKFSYPSNAPYLSVVTPGTHDMSTIRGWWEEDRERIQQFYNNDLCQWGIAPTVCSGEINKTIVTQHLASPAMWSVFMLQDLLGIDEKIRRQNPHEERINVPSIIPFYWRYRMHISLENLLQQEGFNNELATGIRQSGRG